MTTYTDHEFKNLLIYPELNYNAPLAFFTTFEEAEKYVLENGRAITKEFMDIHDSGCALYISPMKNYDIKTDCMEDIRSDIYFIPRDPTYVFSKASYKMVMDENFIFYSRNHADENAQYITYLKKNGTIIKGSTNKEIKRCLELFNKHF
jgi:hypothetical protein